MRIFLSRLVYEGERGENALFLPPKNAKEYRRLGRVIWGLFVGVCGWVDGWMGDVAG